MKFKITLLLSIVFMLNTAMSCDTEADNIDPIYANLIGIEVSNLNNEGEFPKVTDQPIKKEAYMISIKYLTDAEDDDKYYYILKDTIETIKIFTLTDISINHPKGSDVTNLFRKITYQNNGNSYSFLLQEIIQPGVHSFKFILSCTNGKKFETTTNPIELY